MKNKLEEYLNRLSELEFIDNSNQFLKKGDILAFNLHPQFASEFWYKESKYLVTDIQPSTKHDVIIVAKEESTGIEKIFSGGSVVQSASPRKNQNFSLGM